MAHGTTIYRATICTSSIESLGIQLNAFTTSTPSQTVNWPATSDAYFVPFAIGSRLVVQRLFSLNGSVVNGNIDVGLYTFDGTRITSIGGVAQAGASQPQFFDITDLILGPGRYYMAVALDGTGRVVRASPGTVRTPAFGVAKMSSAYPLPATATFETPGNLIPWIGMEIVRAI